MYTFEQFDTFMRSPGVVYFGGLCMGYFLTEMCHLLAEDARQRRQQKDKVVWGD